MMLNRFVVRYFFSSENCLCSLLSRKYFWRRYKNIRFRDLDSDEGWRTTTGGVPYELPATEPIHWFHSSRTPLAVTSQTGEEDMTSVTDRPNTLWLFIYLFITK